MPRPRLHDYDQLRQALLDAGGRILAGQGPHALTLRRVASEVGTSTTAVYTLFGDKAGLVLAMFLEGAARLEQVFAAVPRTDDPVADLFQLGLAYRANARANPHLYELLFGRPIPQFTPDDAAVRQTRGTFEDLVRPIRRCIDAGRFTPADPYEVAVHLNALVHGLASLELRGRLGAAQEADRRWHTALQAAVRGYQPQQPPQSQPQAPGPA
jgi:AcrR family transcriptional regulator